jgi:hypothetical protein
MAGASVDRPIIVTIAAIESRKENLARLLSDLAQQTRPVEFVLVTQTYGTWDVPEVPSLDVFVEDTVVRAGAGQRWVRAQHYYSRYPDAVVFSLDDDFRIEPTYVEFMYQVLTLSDSIGMVAWSGHTDRKHYIPFDKVMDVPLQLWSGGTGLAALYMDTVDLVCMQSDCDEFFAVGGDDELLVSRTVWEQKRRIIRPAGTPPLTSVDALQNARDSMHVRFSQKWARRRKLMIQETPGWHP